MGLKKDIVDQLEQILKPGDYNVLTDGPIPAPGDNRLTFGNTAVRFDAVTLYIDMRGSTKILHEYKAHNVAKIHKAFLFAGTKVITEHKGHIRSYNGDSILAFFEGNSKQTATSAIKAAMQLKYILTEKDASKHFSQWGTIDFGIGLDVGSILCVKAGMGKTDNHNDLIWLGEAVNRAVRLSDRGKAPQHVWVSQAVRHLQEDATRYGGSDKKDIWQEQELTYNEAKEKAWCTSDHSAVS